MPDTFDFRYFDYRQHNSDWAARASIASCLADYINEVHEHHLSSGGDGKVYIVTHSMGGLAVRFATSSAAVPEPVVAGAIGGLVTIATPHLGSVFGDTVEADIAQWAKEELNQSLAPDHASDAARCLALHDQTRALPSGCAVPPYLPGDYPLAEVAGTSIVRRTLFGIPLYDIPLVSDGVVGLDSAHGYLTSGPRGVKPPRIQSYLPTTTCTVTSDQTMRLMQEAVRTKNFPLAIVSIEIKALTILWTDGAVLDAVNEGRLTPELEAMLGVELAFYDCSHVRMPGNSVALDQVSTALHDMLPADVSVADLADAQVPAMCQHPAGQLVDGSLPGLAPSEGYEDIDLGAGSPSAGFTPVKPVLGDFTGDGVGDAAAVIRCSAGGVSWPDTVLIYGPKTTLLDAVDLSEFHRSEHSDLKSMTQDGRDLILAWASYEGCCFEVINWTGRLHWDGKEMQMLDIDGVADPSTAYPDFS